MGSMRDRVAIVTGGSVGIGRAAALAFAREGAYVAIGDVQVDQGEHVVEEIERPGGRRCSLRRTSRRTSTSIGSSTKRLRDSAASLRVQQRRYRRAAGTDRRVHGAELESDDRHQPHRRLAVHAWRFRGTASGGGAIVNNSSVAGLVGFRMMPAYVASKHGVIGLTKTAALDLRLVASA